MNINCLLVNSGGPVFMWLSFYDKQGTVRAFSFASNCFNYRVMGAAITKYSHSMHLAITRLYFILSQLQAARIDTRIYEGELGHFFNSTRLLSMVY